ncbi:unannotated protein [freshwater metagenome]|uniref:Unannotated protein n=1 Tax=freshwater metagenome TaxID=449393 RepID=A0A6J7LD10_9ZZZZ
MQRQRRGEVLGEDVARGLRVRALDLDLHVEPARPQDRGVDHVLTVGGTDHEHVLQRLDTVDLAQQLGDDRVLHVGGDSRPAGAEERVHLVEEHDHRGAERRLLPRPLEHQPDVALGLADVLVEQLGALDVEEVGLPRRSRALGHLLGQGVGHRLGDQRLAAAGRAVEEHALRRLQLVVLEELGVQVGQLDGVADRVDLGGEAADLRVVDVRHLLEHQLLDLRLRHDLVDVAGAGVEQQRVAGADGDVLGAQRLGEADDPLLVGVGDDQGTLAVGEDLLEHHDLADLLEVERGDDVERLVEHDLLAAHEAVELDGRADADPQLATPGEDVDGVVVVAAEEGAEAGRRLRQAVDLLLQRRDLVTGVAQRLRQALVLAGHRGQGPLRVGQAALEAARLPRCVLDATAQVHDLGLQVAHLRGQLLSGGLGHLAPPVQ